jgi:acetyl esterase/lipase
LSHSQVSSSVTSYGSNPDQILERFPGTPDARPTLLLIHGGYWREKFDREHLRPIAKVLAEAGWKVVLAEYRRIPGDPDSTMLDIYSIFSALENESIIVVGYSVGAQLALLTIPKFSNVVGILGLAPVTDLARTDELKLGDNAVQEWLVQPAINRPDLDPMLASNVNIPVIFIHGENDVRVPIKLTKQYVELRAQTGVKIVLIELPGLGHFELMATSGSSWNAIIDALEVLSH